jgi:hypothetical protein
MPFPRLRVNYCAEFGAIRRTSSLFSLDISHNRNKAVGRPPLNVGNVTMVENGA